MIPLLLVSALSVSSLLSIVSGLLPVCSNLRAGFSLGFPVLFIVLEMVGALWRLGRSTTALDIEEVLAGAVDTHVHVFVADVVKSFDTVDRGFLDLVLSSLGLPGWFRHAYFEFHSHVRLRF